MSTPASRRLRLGSAALGLVGLAWVAAVAGLQGLATRAESTGEVYPYQAEDWLRYLLPAIWRGDGRPVLMLAGPSTVRENFLVEEIARAFPGERILNGGLSLGSLTDVVLSLEYIERVYGEEALPGTLVLGVSPRFMADIPAARPFDVGLDLYSPHYRVAAGTHGEPSLQPKSALDGWSDHVRFLMTKQQPRYAAAATWLILDRTGSRLSQAGRGSPWTGLLLSQRSAEIGVGAYMAERISPYKYRAVAPMTLDVLTDWISDPGSWWADVYAWDAAAASASVTARVERLLAFVDRHGIDLHIIGLPERAVSRDRYGWARTESYQALLRSVFEGRPFLDLRCLLEDPEYHDAEHALYPGAVRTTERMIGFVRAVRTARAAGGTEGPADPSDVARWAAPCATGER